MKIANLEIVGETEIHLLTNDKLICQKCNKEYDELFGLKYHKHAKERVFCFKCFREEFENPKENIDIEYFYTCIIKQK